MRGCPINHEQIFEWVDSPAHQHQLEEHVRTCPECAQSVAILRGLGEHLSPFHEPGPDFAASVAARILSSEPVAHRVLAMLRKRFEHFLEPNALSSLLDLKRSKQKGFLLPRLAPVALLYLLPGFYFALHVPDLFRYYLASCLALMFVAIPVYIVQTESTLLKSLYLGRCLEEISTSGISAPMVVDTLALHSLKRIVPLAAAASILLIPSTVFFRATATATAPGVVDWFFPALALWIPATLAALVGGSYCYQAYTTGAAGRSRTALVPTTLLALGLAGSSLNALLDLSGLANPASKLGLPRGSAGWDLTLALSLIAAAGFLAAMRELAIRHYQNLSLAQEKGERSRRTQRVSAPAENPIYAREVARQGRPWGTLILPLLWAVWVAYDPRSEYSLDTVSQFTYQGLLLMAVTAPVFSLSTLSAISRERQSGTWDSLLQTRLTASEFVSGWKKAAARRFLWWATPTLPAIFGFGLTNLLLPEFGFTPLGLTVLFTLTLALVAQSATTLGLVLAFQDTGKTAPTRKLMGLLGAGGVIYVTVLAAGQMFLESLAMGLGERWSEGWMILQDFGLPFLSLLGVAAGASIWSGRQLRLRLQGDLLSDLTRPVPALAWWLNPWLSSVAATCLLTASMAATGAFLPALGLSLAAICFPWAWLMRWLLQPLSARLGSVPASAAQWAGRLLTGTLGLGLPGLLLSLSGPWVGALYNRGFWKSPASMWFDQLPQHAFEAAAACTVFLSLGQRFRSRSKVDASEEIERRLDTVFVRRLASAAVLSVALVLSVNACLRAHFHLNAAQLEEVASFRANLAQQNLRHRFRLQLPEVVRLETPLRSPHQSRSDYLASIPCDPATLRPALREKIREVIAAVPNGFYAQCLSPDGVQEELVHAALWNESRGHTAEALDDYRVILQLSAKIRATSYHFMASKLGDFIRSNSLSASDLQGLAELLQTCKTAEAARIADSPFERRYARDYRDVRMDYIVEAPAFYRDAEVYGWIQGIKRRKKALSHSAEASEFLELETYPMSMELENHIALDLLDLRIKLQLAYLRDGHYPDSLPPTDLPPWVLNYTTTGNRCEVNLRDVPNARFYSYGLPQRRFTLEGAI